LLLLLTTTMMMMMTMAILSRYLTLPNVTGCWQYGICSEALYGSIVYDMAEVLCVCSKAKPL